MSDSYTFFHPNDFSRAAKGCIISIYIIRNNGLEYLVDFPMYGKVVFMEFSRVADKFLLFVATEVEKLCIFKWDANTSNVVSTHTLKFFPTLVGHGIGNERYEHTDYCQGGTISANGRTVVLYSRQKWLRVIQINHEGHGASKLKKSFHSTKFLDVKFLTNSIEPRLALLFQGEDGDFHSGTYMILAEDVVQLKSVRFAPTIEPACVIPCLSSFLIIGKESVVYVDADTTKPYSTGYFDIQAHGRVDENAQRSRHLLGGHDGHLLLIEVKKTSGGRFSSLTHRPLGRISIASTITYLGDDVVFVGSRLSDSQLVKMHQLDEPSLNVRTPDLEVLKTFANPGPIVDFSISNRPHGLRKLAVCSGTHEESCLEVLSTGVGISEKLRINGQTIKRIWSLKILTLGEPVLIAQDHDLRTFAFTTDDSGAITSFPMKGMASGSTIVCFHGAGKGKLVQVTEKSVQLIDFMTGAMLFEWHAKSIIMFASANAKQVLLSTDGNELIYLEIGDWNWVNQVSVKKGYDVSCLDISPVDAHTSCSKLAAIGTWKPHSIVVLSLPDLNVLTVEMTESDVPRCILHCSFEQVQYLLCGLSDGTLLTFKMNTVNGGLHEKTTKQFRGIPMSLHTLSSNGVERVLFLSTDDAPQLIFTKKQKLQYNRLNLTNILDMRPFQSAKIPEGLAIVKEDGVVVICTMGDIEGHAKVPMVNYGRRICHQEESESYAILVEEKSMRHLVQLVDKELNTVSSFRLNKQELGLSIVSCSFAGDSNAYYCVGTSIDVPGEINTAQGRILVFTVRDGELHLISQSPTTGAVYYLKPLHGGLLATVSRRNSHYFEWNLQGGDHLLVENTNIEIDAGEARFATISSMIQKYEMHDVNIAINPKTRLEPTAILILQESSLLYADKLFNLRSTKGFCRGEPVEVGQLYIGEFVTQIKAGTLSTLADEEYAKAPSALFSTTSGAIGVVVSLPQEVYCLLHKLQVLMRKRKKGKGCPYENAPENCVGLSGLIPHKEFIDGDFLQRFPSLDLKDQMHIAQKIGISVRDLMEITEYIKVFH